MRSLVFLLIGLALVAVVLAQTEESPSEQLRRSDLSDRERADVAIQQARSYTTQALAASPEARDALWKRADDACATLIDGWPDNPRRPLVEVQRALVALARGEQARQQSADIEPSLKHLRDARRRLADVSESVGQALVQMRLRPGSNPTEGALTIEELESLESHIAYNLARAERQVGVSYPPGSADRDDALLQAIRRLAPLAGQARPDDLIWDARVELVACQRDLGRNDSAQKLVAAWLKEDPPAEVATRLSAAPVESTTPTRAQPTNTVPNDDFAAKLTTIANLRTASRFADAAQAYRRLAVDQSNHPRAAEAHRLAILSMADLLRASEPANRTNLSAAYESVLKEHLAEWPNDSSSDEVRLWLGALLAARRDWPAAIHTLQQVRPTAGCFAQSVDLFLCCCDSQLASLNDSAKQAPQRVEVLSAATQHLQPIVTGANNRWPDEWSQLQRTTAIALARLHLRYTDQPSPYAERLLTAALDARPAADDTEKHQEWERESRVLLVAALVRNGKTTEAKERLGQMTATPIGALVELIAEIDKQLMSQPQREAGEVALALARMIEARRAELEQSILPRLAMYRATALAAMGDRPAAIAQLAVLAAEAPQDAEIQERNATLLAASDSPAELHQSLAQWQQVESRSKRGGPRWRRARQARIELLTRLGDQTEAEKLIRLTRLLYPNEAISTQPAP